MDTEAMVQSLREAFAAVPDPRSAQGRRHPLAAILTLATAAMLAGARTLYDIWQWGRVQEPAVVRAVGFTRDKTPAVSTLHRVFSRLDVAAFEGTLRSWAQAQLGDGEEAIAIDGKGLRGIHGEELPGVRLVCKVEREAERKGQRRREVRYVVSSLGPAVSAARLLELVRGHWAIENRLHWVREVTCGEEACGARTGAAPALLEVMGGPSLPRCGAGRGDEKGKTPAM